MNLLDRENIDRKLIELVKPHEALYNGKSSSHDYMGTRAKLWAAIRLDINRAFNLNRSVDEWKTRWLALRSSYRQGLLTKVNRRSNVCDDMEFLRQYTHINSNRIGRTNYKKPSKKSSKKASKNNNKQSVKSEASARPKREKHTPQQMHKNGDDSSLTYSDSSYQMFKRETVEANDGCFEIIVPDDDDEVIINDELSVNTENHIAGDPFDEDIEDSDGAFGMLITRELREMDPDIKREFKRTVTQLLYS